MHDIALLKRLSRDQLERVIRLDSLTRGNHLWGMAMLSELTQFIARPDLINALLLSWAQQHEKTGMNGIAADYYRVVDERTGSSERRAHAIRIVSFNFLNECENIEWHHVVQISDRALELRNGKVAFDCFAYLFDRAAEIFRAIEQKEVPIEKIAEAKSEAKQMMRCAQKGFKNVLYEALQTLSIDLLEKCLYALDRKLTQPEIQCMRCCLVIPFVNNKLNDAQTEYMIEFLIKHGSDSEKRACLNSVASRGEVRELEELSVKWNIPLTERHWRRVLGKHWFSQDKVDDTETRVQILIKLVAFSPRYEPLLLRARASAREEAIGFGEIILSDEIGELIHKPLTLDELTRFMRMFGKDERYQKIQVPFAVNKMIELVAHHP